RARARQGGSPLLPPAPAGESQPPAPPYRSHGAVPDHFQQLIPSGDDVSWSGNSLHRREVTPTCRPFSWERVKNSPSVAVNCSFSPVRLFCTVEMHVLIRAIIGFQDGI